MTFLANEENYNDLYWGIETWEASSGEKRIRIFVLLGNNSVRRMLILLGKLRVWVVCHSTGELS